MNEKKTKNVSMKRKRNKSKKKITSYNEICFEYTHAMDSPLSPAMLDFTSKISLYLIKNSQFYFRDVDGIFCVFDSQEWVKGFHGLLNKMHTALRYVCEKEKKKNNRILPFLHMLVFLFYFLQRKPTFNGL